MGVFLQYALFPGCDETSTRVAVEAAGKAGFVIDLEKCRYAQSYEGTQVLMEGTSWVLRRWQKRCLTWRSTR